MPRQLLATQEALEPRAYLAAVSFNFSTVTDLSFPASSTLPTSIVAADVNGDGKPDIIFTNTGGGYSKNGADLGVEIADGSSSGPIQLVPGTGSYLVGPLSVADVTGDGKADIVCGLNQANDADGQLAVFPGNGNGAFQSPILTPTLSGKGIAGLAIADFNGDGKPDLAVTYPDTSLVEIFLNQGNGTFAAAESFATAPSPAPPVAADINGDGHADLLIDSPSGAVTVLLGIGNGGFHFVETVAP